MCLHALFMHACPTCATSMYMQFIISKNVPHTVFLLFSTCHLVLISCKLLCDINHCLVFTCCQFPSLLLVTVKSKLIEMPYIYLITIICEGSFIYTCIDLYNFAVILISLLTIFMHFPQVLVKQNGTSGWWP